jgi:putative ABC transport system permease protein
MKRFNILSARLRALFRRESVLRDIEEELRIHVEMETETNIERGLPPDEARAAAQKSVGNLGRNTEISYDVRGGRWLETISQDLRYGARMLIKQPGFTAIAVLTLALGIGANTAVFSIVNSFVFRPRPVAEPERLVELYSGDARNPYGNSSYQDFLTYCELSPGAARDEGRPVGGVEMRMTACLEFRLQAVRARDPQKPPEGGTPNGAV